MTSEEASGPAVPSTETRESTDGNIHSTCATCHRVIWLHAETGVEGWLLVGRSLTSPRGDHDHEPAGHPYLVNPRPAEPSGVPVTDNTTDPFSDVDYEAPIDDVADWFAANCREGAWGYEVVGFDGVEALQRFVRRVTSAAVSETRDAVVRECAQAVERMQADVEARAMGPVSGVEESIALLRHAVGMKAAAAAIRKLAEGDRK